MERNIELLRNYWFQHKSETKETFLTHQVSFEKLLNSIFSIDSLYYYIIDHCEKSIVHISPSIEDIHGISAKFSRYNDVLDNIHPQDLNFFLEAEKASLAFIFENIEIDNILNYRSSYNFRARNKNGTYSLFNHQTIVLNLDENKGCGLTLNIHTNIDHLNCRNTKSFSLIGTNENPSYLNLKVSDDLSFTKREVEIIKLIADGKANKEIADALFISPLTVKKHRSNILNKSECKNIIQLIRYSTLAGVI